MDTLNLKKLDSPYLAGKDKMNDLAFRIQSAAGLNPQEIFPRQHTPVIENRVSPVQLSVEFGVANRSIQAPANEEKSKNQLNVAVSSYTDKAVNKIEVKDNIVEDKPEFKVEQKEIIKPDLTETEISELPSTKSTIERDVPSPAIPNRIEEPAKVGNKTEAVEPEEAENKASEVVNKVNIQHEQPTRKDHTLENQSSFQFPWASLLGLVATAVAVFGAYWVWTNIQKPTSVEDVVHNVSNQTPIGKRQSIVQPVTTNSTPKQPEMVELTTEHELLSALLVNKPNNQSEYLDFVASDEPSKVSMVELEKKGFIVLELEDDLFDPIRL